MRKSRVRVALVGTVVTVLVVLFAASLIAGCGGSSEESKTVPLPVETAPSAPGTPTAPSGEVRVFTVQELASFDGSNGQPAYIAVDGVVYDVSGKPNWPAGDHAPCNLEAMAGQELSAVLKQAPPSMRGYVESLPVVGKLTQ